MLAMYNLALAYEHTGLYEDAGKWIRKGLLRDPRDSGFQRLDFRVRVLKLRSAVVRSLKRAVFRSA